MARKIRAKTLAGLLGSYLARFPEETAAKAERCEPGDAAELLALLTPDDAWTLLRLVERRTGREWLERCDADGLRRLVRSVAPERLEPGAEVEKRDLLAAAIESLHPAAGLPGSPLESD